MELDNAPTNSFDSLSVDLKPMSTAPTPAATPAASEKHSASQSDVSPSICSSSTSLDDVRASTDTLTPQQQHNNNNHQQPQPQPLQQSCPMSHQYHYIQYHAPYYHYINNNNNNSGNAQQQQQQHHHQLLSTDSNGGPAMTTMMNVPQPPAARGACCQCTCSCGAATSGQAFMTQRQPSQPHHPHLGTTDGRMAVDVVVHSTTDGSAVPWSSLKTQSEQSLLNHSYQALQEPHRHSGEHHPQYDGCGGAVADADEKKPLNVLGNSKLNVSCDCDLECTCGRSRQQPAASHHQHHPHHHHHHPSVQHQMPSVDPMLGVDEITVSESDNNSTMVKKRRGAQPQDEPESKLRNSSWCRRSRAEGPDGGHDESGTDIYNDDDIKDSGGIVALDDARPPLPPRPPRPRMDSTSSSSREVPIAGHRHNPGIKKYVIWCLVCGGCSCILGILFLGLYFLLHSYTITVGNFETVPTFVPGALLILTGMCIMSLARRKNRYSYLIKLSGACGLISALTCALVTVTTTVLHMSRLQALRECEYAQKTRTCTCYSDVVDGAQIERGDKEGVRLVFDSLSDCGVVHGSLYSCLRAIFGLSVAGVLIAVFSCMLVYQLLSHERKKMYWEQLELRCRSLYTSQQANVPAVGSMRGAMCRCCESCHAHRQMPLQLQMPGNFYSPNPGMVDEHHLHGSGGGGGTLPGCRGPGAHRDVTSGGTAAATTTTGGRTGRMTGWNWPWQRNSPLTGSRFTRQTPSSPDSQYGFSQAAAAGDDNLIMEDPMAVAAASAAANAHAAAAAAAAYNSLPYGVWGPPPPYSDPNSPARRGFYHYVQQPQQQCPMTAAMTNGMAGNVGGGGGGVGERPMQMLGGGGGPVETLMQAPQCLGHGRGVFQEAAPPQSSPGVPVSMALACGNNTLPHMRKASRKPKNSACLADAAEMPPLQLQPGQSMGFPGADGGSVVDERDYHEAGGSAVTAEELGGMHQMGGNCNLLPRNGVSCGQKLTPRQKRRDPDFHQYAEHTEPPQKPQPQPQQAHGGGGGCSQQEDANCDPAESEVYFADVSSCNMSVKNDNYYEEANSAKHAAGQTSSTSNLTAGSNNNNNGGGNNNNTTTSCSSASSNDGDYLAQRFGKRENSIRSRLPFPQTSRYVQDSSDYGENLNVLHAAPKALTNSSMAINLNISGHQPQQQQGGPPSSQMQKEVSRQSMCSVESEAKTEYTDLSPSTPCSNKFVQTQFAPEAGDVHPMQQMGGNNNFVAGVPYCSESQSLEAHRRSTKDIHELMLAPQTEAHYEMINEAHQQQQQLQQQQQQFHMLAQKANLPMGGGGGGSHSHGHNHSHSHQHGHSHGRHAHAHSHGGGHSHAAMTAATAPQHKSKPKSKSRERLNASSPVVGGPLQSKEMLEWSEKSSLPPPASECGDRRL